MGSTRGTPPEKPTPCGDWRQVVRQLREDNSGPTIAQMELAERIGLALDASTPRRVVAALLRRHMGEALELPSTEATDGQLEYLHDLAAQIGFPEPPVSGDREMVDAWIQVMYDRRAAAFLEELQPMRGDVVVIGPPDSERLREVSSIGPDGCLYFRGGSGQRARPHQIRMFARKSDANWNDAAYTAQQQVAALIKNPQQSGMRRVSELTPWRVTNAPSTASVLALEDALASATDERPLQKTLEKHPEILAYLVSGHHGIYVIPQAALGKEYIPDFLIAAETSAGLWWTLVELESPNAALYIADGQHSKQLRKGIKQITDWREWLADNSDYARRSIQENGLGLPGIRADARGLVIISRESMSKITDALRLRELGERNIEIRTYDWLVRASQAWRGLPAGVLDAELGEQSDQQG